MFEPFHGVSRFQSPGVQPTVRFGVAAVGATVYIHGAAEATQSDALAADCGGIAGEGPAVTLEVLEYPIRMLIPVFSA
jgi:hypothetical protein